VIAALQTAIAVADAAETATKTRTKGTVAARNAAVTALVSELHVAKAFVRQIGDADPEHAETIIAALGFVVRKATTFHKAPLTTKQGTTFGTVKLAAKAAGPRASYEWEHRWREDLDAAPSDPAVEDDAHRCCPWYERGVPVSFRDEGRRELLSPNGDLVGEVRTTTWPCVGRPFPRAGTPAPRSLPSCPSMGTTGE
jgi:hypothetical protein